MYRTLFGSLLAATAIAATATQAQAQRLEESDYALPAQGLAQSLREVSVRSGRSVIAPSALVAGRSAPALNGRYNAEGAVGRLLAGSGLAFRSVGDSLVIYEPAPDSAATEPVQEQDSPGEARVVVTGTHLRGAPATSPTIVIGREDIERSGATSVEQLMRRVPQNSQSGVNQETASSTLAGAVTMADLVRSTLRLRPDRIIVGEVRGREALDMLKAWNTGHPGGIATVHANSAISALYRLEQLVQESVITVPRRLIAEAIDMIVFIAGRGTGRRIETIARVAGLDPDGGYAFLDLTPNSAAQPEGE